ncbi:uncharacterized protein Tsen54 [Panulirus ornatus]|uniref:uncharacterized protein Tsen54 n=1 Tax=Panulirus ornatus TaxID=150431 RepID=UPI003A85C691
MTSPKFSSGETLFRSRGRDQALPVTGEKQAEVSESWLENKRLDSLLQDHQSLLAEPKFARRDQLACGEWLAESRMVRVVHETGKFWQYMGAETDIGKCLYPEEALYLIDTGELEVTFGGVALSVQQAQTLMLEDAHHLDQYHVYAHLSRTGYKVVRHQTHLVFTCYEKQIRLDQHQISKKGTKLKLKNKVSSADTQEDIEVIESKNENLEDAVKELYAVLGSAADNPYKPLKDVPEELINIESVERKESFEDKRKNVHEDISAYEKKRKEFLAMFPSVPGENSFSINVEASELLPKNSIPPKKTYEISLEALDYYSLYRDSSQDWQNNFQSRQTHNYRQRRGRGNSWKKRDTNQPWRQNDHESDSRTWRQDNSNFRPEWARDSARDSARNRDSGEGKNDSRWDNGSRSSFQAERDRHFDNMNDRRVNSWNDGTGYGKESIGESSYGRREPERQIDDDRYHNGCRNPFNSERDRCWDNSDERGMKSWCGGVSYGTESQHSSYGRREPEWQQHDNRRYIGSGDSSNFERDKPWNISDDRGGTNWQGSAGFGMESQCSSSHRRREPEWQQHGDRWSHPSYPMQNNRPVYNDQQGSEFCNDLSSRSQGRSGFDASEKGLDYSKAPDWKTRRRRQRRKEGGSYPSCLVRLNTKVGSWKEYKKLVNKTSAEKLLANGPARSLWMGHTTPLIKPAIATTTQAVLSGCTINDESVDLSIYQEKLPTCMQLTVHYDIYLPTVPYKKSNPTTPSKRITVIRDASMPTPGQILEVTTRFHDDVPVVSAVVMHGEVRLYTLTPLMLPQPKPSR